MGAHSLRTELLLAPGAVVLSILGLARVFPMYLTAISISALGAVLLFQGATVAWHFSDLLHQAGASKAGVAEVGGGITTLTYSATLLMTSGEAAWLS